MRFTLLLWFGRCQFRISFNIRNEAVSTEPGIYILWNAVFFSIALHAFSLTLTHSMYRLRATVLFLLFSSGCVRDFITISVFVLHFIVISATLTASWNLFSRHSVFFHSPFVESFALFTLLSDFSSKWIYCARELFIFLFRRRGKYFYFNIKLWDTCKDCRITFQIHVNNRGQHSQKPSLRNNTQSA